MTQLPPNIAAAMIPDSREAKLPRWATDILTSLRHYAADSARTAEAARLDTNPDGSHLVLVRYGVSLDSRASGLPPYTHVEFRPDLAHPRDTLDLRATDRGRGMQLEVCAVGGGISVRPVSSNVVTLALTDD